MPNHKSYSYSTRGFSMRFDIKSGFADFYNQYPQRTVDITKQVAEAARMAHYDETPYAGGQLRENVTIVGYTKGSLGGTVYVQWRAQNPKDGYHYAKAQNEGGTRQNYYVYHTPGTGPHFMDATMEDIVANVGEALADGTQDLIQETAV